MKTPVSFRMCRHWSLWIFAFAGLPLVTQAQQLRDPQPADAPSKISVTSRSAHERILEQVTSFAGDDGSLRSQTNTVVELATGLHYLDDSGQWAESSNGVASINCTFVPKTSRFPECPMFRCDPIAFSWTTDGRTPANWRWATA